MLWENTGQTFVEQLQRVPVSDEDFTKNGEEVGRVHWNIFHQLPQLLHNLPHTQYTLKYSENRVNLWSVVHWVHGWTWLTFSTHCLEPVIWIVLWSDASPLADSAIVGVGVGVQKGGEKEINFYPKCGGWWLTYVWHNCSSYCSCQFSLSQENPAQQDHEGTCTSYSAHCVCVCVCVYWIWKLMWMMNLLWLQGKSFFYFYDKIPHHSKHNCNRWRITWFATGLTLQARLAVDLSLTP